MAIGAGFGWYSLSSAILAPISGGEIGIMALLTNIFREMLSIMLLPLVVHYLGKTAAVAPGGATTMDTTLPFVVKYAGSEMSILSFVSGVDPVAARRVPRARPRRALKSQITPTPRVQAAT